MVVVRPNQFVKGEQVFNFGNAQTKRHMLNGNNIYFYENVEKIIQHITVNGSRTDEEEMPPNPSWTIPNEHEKTIDVTYSRWSYILVMDSDKAVRIKVIYPDGKEQIWRHTSGGKEVQRELDIDVTYVFKLNSKNDKVNIGIIYEDGDMEAEVYQHSGEEFTFLPKNNTSELKVTFYKDGEKKTELVDWRTDKRLIRDCEFGNKICNLHLIGNLLDQTCFQNYIQNFHRILTTRNLCKEKYMKVVNKVLGI